MLRSQCSHPAHGLSVVQVLWAPWSCVQTLTLVMAVPHPPPLTLTTTTTITKRLDYLSPRLPACHSHQCSTHRRFLINSQVSSDQWLAYMLSVVCSWLVSCRTAQQQGVSGSDLPREFDELPHRDASWAQTCYLTHSQCSDTMPSSPSSGSLMPGILGGRFGHSSNEGWCGVRWVTANCSIQLTMSKWEVVCAVISTHLVFGCLWCKEVGSC